MALSPTSSRSSGGGVTELAYSTFTAIVNLTATSEATANAIVTATAVACDGATEVTIEFYADYIDTPGGAGSRGTFIVLYDAIDGGAAASLGQIAAAFDTTTNASRHPTCVRRKYTPAAGSHVWSVRGYVTAGTGHASAGVGGVGTEMPGYIRVLSGA